ncbi:MAG: PAS domain-containing protein [Dehalococcoidia bacterium]
MTHAAEAIQESLASVLAKVPVAILLADTEGRYAFANNAACELLGRSRSEIVSSTVRELAADSIEAEINWREFLATRHSEGESAVVRGDGSNVPVRFSSSCDFVHGLHITVLHDLSEREQTERAIRRDEELFNRAFRASPIPTNIRRLDNGGIVDVNQAFIEATGFPRSDLIGRSAQSIGFWVDSAGFEEMLNQLRAGESIARGTSQVETRDGVQKVFHVALQRFDVDGESLAMATYTDLTALLAEVEDSGAQVKR